ncbi:MAG: hypothetical protein ACXW32_10805 [Limisphaerales bacterium]
MSLPRPRLDSPPRPLSSTPQDVSSPDFSPQFPLASFVFMRVALLLWLLLPPMCNAADPRERLREALRQEDLAAIQNAVAQARHHLGDDSGVPEVPDQYLAIPNEPPFTAAEAQSAYQRTIAEIERLRWWRIDLEPATLSHPLREPASVISGAAAAVRAKLDGQERALVQAKEAADFLIWAQNRAGRGLFPFPAVTSPPDKQPFKAAAKFLEHAARQGRLEQVTHNGWIIEDELDGGLQFDNGESGVALFELYEATGNTNYLRAATLASDWCAARPLAVNWNYNSFSVYLLAKSFQVTRNTNHLEVAIKKARLGVIPGQLRDGPNAGRWLDPHNARPAYHYIMLRALAQLAETMPRAHPHRSEIIGSLRAGLRTRNREFKSKGASGKDKPMETLILVHRAFSSEPEFLKETYSDEALQELAKLVSAQARRGGQPLSPREWGAFLEFSVKR